MFAMRRNSVTMHRSHAFIQINQLRRRTGWWAVALAVALAGLLALASIAGNRASGTGTLVVIEDASQLGSGSFSGNVCYQVIRNRDGVTISEGCFSIATTIAAPEDLDAAEQYSIVIFLADANCLLLDDPRTGNGASPFYVRVSCDSAYMTATAGAGGSVAPAPADAGVADDGSTETPAVELTAWPPAYDVPTAVTIGPVATVIPQASPIAMPASEHD
jgi:hypothetical protein